MDPSVISVGDSAMLPGIAMSQEDLSATAAIRKDILLGIVLKVTARYKWNAISAMRKGILPNSAEVLISINLRLRQMREGRNDIFSAY